MGPLVVDIETSGYFEDLAEPVQEYLIEREGRYAEDKDPYLEVANSLPLNPALGTIVSIGMWLPEEGRGAVLVNNQTSEIKSSIAFERYNEEIAVFYGSEPEILREFWKKADEKAGQRRGAIVYPIVTFNGRSFDGPFLMLRSIIHGIQPTRNLVGYRYSLREHCDLQEVLTFLGSLDWRYRYSLDFWCHQFGIKSRRKT